MKRVLAGVVVMMFAACSDPRVAEDRAAACANKIDDDGDGLIDCEDPDCAATEACEKTEATCSNGIDDDRNGSLDCRQESCRVLPICKDAVERPCQLSPSAQGTGCELGKGCYIGTSDTRRWCALEGPSSAGGACGNTDPSDRSRGCAAGHLCGNDQRCARICNRPFYDCTRNSICTEVITGVSLCSLSCLPPSGCRANELCVAFQRGTLALEDGGWAHRCIPSPGPAAGTAGVGDPCIDPAPRPGADVCAPGLLCIPEPGGPRCRKVCRGDLDGVPTPADCAAGSLCFPVVPFSAQGERFDEPYAIGVCR